jgi:hypothetical protein
MMMPGVTKDTLTVLPTDMSRGTGTSLATARGDRPRGRRTTNRGHRCPLSEPCGSRPVPAQVPYARARILAEEQNASHLL